MFYDLRLLVPTVDINTHFDKEFVLFCHSHRVKYDP